MQAGKQTCRQASRHAGRQAGKQVSRQAGMQACRVGGSRPNCDVMTNTLVVNILELIS
jgi:hypothetical protein